jgi:hypothetical protein
MPQSTMSYIISFIKSSVPREILELSFQPNKYNTTVEQRIISEIIEGPILLDTNLVGGKRRDIFINSNWEMQLDDENQYDLVGTGIQGSFYKVPPEAREGRNISSVIGIVPSVGINSPGTGFDGSFGNNATGMLSQMLNTHSMSQTYLTPQVTLEGTNIIRFYPRQIVSAVAVSVMLEYDSEFLNMNQSGILALRRLCLCATQRYIATKLRVPIDETEVVAGLEIGVIKDIVNDYTQKAEQYDDCLRRLTGALRYDPRTISKLIYHAL